MTRQCSQAGRLRNFNAKGETVRMLNLKLLR
jgi:hypothetical protein